MSADLGLGYYRLAMDRLAGGSSSSIGAGPDWTLSDEIEIIEQAARAALERAQALTGIQPGGTDNPAGDKIPVGTDATIASAWKTLVRQATIHEFPHLQQTKDRAKADPAYASKWLDTARALLSEMQTVADGAKDQGLLEALKSANQAIEDADRKLGEAVKHGAQKAGRAVKEAASSAVDAAASAGRAIADAATSGVRDFKIGVAGVVILGVGGYAIARGLSAGRPDRKGGR